MVALFSLFLAIACQLIIFKIYKIKKLQLTSTGNENGKCNFILVFLIRKILGFLLLGFIPGMIIFSLYPIPLNHYGLAIKPDKFFWFLTLITVVIVFINRFLANRPTTFSRYPEMRFVEWTKDRLAISFIGWFIYLLGYEFLFRGLLLFSFCSAFGWPIAIVLNVILYSAAHITKGREEILGSVPFGLLLCTLAFYTGSIFIPFLIHFSLAISTEYYSIYYNPNMHFL
jgi:membrane protease YdiL (CAAX protease family)